MPSTDVGVTTVHWVQAGSGEPVVLLHGLGSDVSFWTVDIEAWAPHFHVIALDLRGSGQTPASPGGHTIADLADDVAAVLDDAGIGSAHVVGLSMGGLVAQEFALRYPHRLDRLVLAATFATMNARTRRFLDAVLAVYEAGAPPRQVFSLFCPWLFSLDFQAEPANAPYTEYPGDEANHQTMADWRALYRAQRAFDGTAGLPQIAAPTLVILGEHDALVSSGDARTLAAAIPGSRLQWVAGSGHLVNLEAPEEFDDAVRSFLAAPRA